MVRLRRVRSSDVVPPSGAGPVIGRGMPRSRPSRSSAAVALLVHLGLGLLLIRLAPTRNLSYEPPAGPPGPDDRSGGGGGGGRGIEIRFVALAPPPPAPMPVPIVPPPPPVQPTVTETPTPVPAPVDSMPSKPSTGTASGSGSGAGTGTGTGSGTGSGSGSGSGKGSGNGSGEGPGSGEGGKARPPEPRQLILPPPDVPKPLRGVTMSVTFMVGPEGRVDDVRFSPEPDDRGFARKLEEVMRNYRFRPARGLDGLPIAGTFTVQVTF